MYARYRKTLVLISLACLIFSLGAFLSIIALMLHTEHFVTITVVALFLMWGTFVGLFVTGLARLPSLRGPFWLRCILIAAGIILVANLLHYLGADPKLPPYELLFEKRYLTFAGYNTLSAMGSLFGPLLFAFALILFDMLRMRRRSA